MEAEPKLLKLLQSTSPQCRQKSYLYRRDEVQDIKSVNGFDVCEMFEGNSQI